MQLTQRQLLILQGKICPYCGQDTVYEDSAVIYGRSYGMIYHCQSCRAYVGVHKGTDKALGRVADAELRKWKIAAHNAFDPLWKTGLFKRKEAYQWLSKLLDIPAEYTHIGFFSVDTCKKVVDIIESSLEQLKQQNAKR
jgi:uncharacterized protein DUF3268